LAHLQPIPKPERVIIPTWAPLLKGTAYWLLSVGLRSTMPEQPLNSAASGYPSSPDDLRRRIDERSRSTDSITLAVVLNGQIVGWIDAFIEQHLQSSASAVIGGLVVRDDTRGLGIGKRLCLEIEQWARSKSIPLLRVRSQIVREDAHRFYLREGYCKVKTSLVFEKPLL
jgi:GNAT superfamily N-acetyltransferase